MSPRIGKKTPKNGNQCKFLNFKVTHFKKIKGVGARLTNDLSQKRTLLPKGIGRYAGKTATVQDGSGLPYECNLILNKNIAPFKRKTKDD
jgi:hypothetical protein